MDNIFFALSRQGRIGEFRRGSTASASAREISVRETQASANQGPPCRNKILITMESYCCTLRPLCMYVLCRLLQHRAVCLLQAV